jgi:hypothetical protein
MAADVTYKRLLKRIDVNTAEVIRLIDDLYIYIPHNSSFFSSYHGLLTISLKAAGFFKIF